MFKEFAVQPDAIVQSYLQFAYVIEKFGITEGRLIARFPKRWKSLVYGAAAARLKGTNELKKIEYRLQHLGDDVFWSRGRPGEGADENWLQAALAEHERRPFDTVLTADAIDVPGVVPLADLDGVHPCLVPNRQWHVPRDAELMAACCGPILAGAKHVKLVDPHFNINAQRYRRPMAAFLRDLRPGTRVDVFRGSVDDEAELLAHLDRWWIDAVPAGVELGLYLLPKDEVHNRYVMTNIGGIYFQTGLDDAGLVGARKMDDIGVMVHAIWQEHWQRYAGDIPIGKWVR